MIFKPRSTEHLMRLMRETRDPYRVAGASTSFTEQYSGVTLSTLGLRGIVEFDPKDQYVHVAAGTALSDLEATLAAENQVLAFEPPDPTGLYGRGSGRPTVGGMYASNSSGPRSLSPVGDCKASVRGVSFINFEGELLHEYAAPKGQAPAGHYADLLCGSYGALGVVTAFSLKTAPKPELSQTLGLEVKSIHDVQQVMSFVFTQSYDVSGATANIGENWHLYLRFEGVDVQLKARMRELRYALQRCFSQKILSVDLFSGEISRELWIGFRDRSAFRHQPFVLRAEGDLSRIAKLWHSLGAFATRINRIQLDLGGKQMLLGVDQPQFVIVLQDALKAIGLSHRLLKGSLPIETRAANETRALIENIKKQFDPKDFPSGERH